jgi:hypothetical protein
MGKMKVKSKKGRKRGQATFFITEVRPYLRECYKDEIARKYLFPVARPDPKDNPLPY